MQTTSFILSQALFFELKKLATENNRSLGFIIRELLGNSLNIQVNKK